MLGGIATLLASPVSWLHHFVWVVPLAVVLVRDLLPVGAPRRLPAWFGVLGLIFCGWVAVEPFRNLPGGGDLELDLDGRRRTCSPPVTLLLGVAVPRRRRGRGAAPVADVRRRHRGQRTSRAGRARADGGHLGPARPGGAPVTTVDASAERLVVIHRTRHAATAPTPTYGLPASVASSTEGR